MPPKESTAAGAPGFARGSTSAVLARGYKPRASGEPKARPLTLKPDIFELRMIAAMRFILAVSALLIIFIDPAEPDRFVALTYAALALYTLYSAAIYGLTFIRGRAKFSLHYWSHWADIAWFTLLISLSSGTNSIFFIFYFFPIIVVSFRWGLTLGLCITIIASALFMVFGYLTAPAAPAFELNRFLLRPVSLLVLGYMIAFRGNHEIILHRRLALLKEIGRSLNPRFGIDRVIGGAMERLRAFYDADEILAVFSGSEPGGARLRRVRRGDPDGGDRSESAPPAVAGRLLDPPSNHALVYSSSPAWSVGKKYSEVDIEKNEPGSGYRPRVRDLANFLDARNFISIPLVFHGEVAGRIYLTSRRDLFRPSDVGFLLQAVDQIAPVLENVRLVDRLAVTAAEEERRKIARDIHDSLIQPYIGLQLGLSSIRQKFLEACAETPRMDAPTREMMAVLTERLQRLTRLAEDGIVDLRGYVSRLREGGVRSADLVGAVERFASRFQEATGIEVRVDAGEAGRIDDRIAAEVFQIVAEGLSNIRRHTSSAGATVRLRRAPDSLVLEIVDEGGAIAGFRPFEPRSIVERAEALKGNARVERLETGGSSVIVEIPLKGNAHAEIG